MKRRLIVVVHIVLLSGLLAIAPSGSAQAANYFFTANNATWQYCTSTFVGVNFDLSYNLPSGTSLSIVERFNGVISYTSPPYLYPVGGSFSGVGSRYSFVASGGNPYSYSWTYTFSGTFSGQTVITVNC